MPLPVELALFGAASVFLGMTAVWLLSLRLRDASIVDVAWGLGFVLIAWVYFLAGPKSAAQQLLCALVSLWGLRLAAHIAWRARGKGEDYRYATMRRHHGTAFARRSLVRVFWLQGALIVVIATPLLAALGSPSEPGWRLTDVLGVAIFLIGFLFEAIGDWQLARFKADPANRGKVMDRGLWSYTRHPNYFGDAVVWWGFYLLACHVPWGAWTWPAPLLMTFFLLEVSGVALLEKTIAERRPAYRDYIARTSAFVPWPPKRRVQHRA